MSNGPINEHLSAERLQAFLDGLLSEGERNGVEEHLASCARCTAELDGWRTLFEGLEDLPTLAPQSGFADRVMTGVHAPEPLSWAARVRARLMPGAEIAHPGDERLQDWVEGMLPTRQAARVRTHLEDCSSCSSRADAWRTVLGGLNGLERFAPAEDFAARVMAEVHVPVPAPAVQAAPEWRRALGRALAAARRVVPHTRKAWAAISGVALTPAVTVGLMIWTVFTHPTVTPGAVASFAWWKATDLAGAAWNAVASRALESAEVFGIFSFFKSLALSPTLVAGAFLAFSLATVAAAWVLYRNLYTHPSEDGYAHASLR